MSQSATKSKKKDLPSGCEECDQCSGSGKIEIVAEEVCTKCLGEGSLDWVERVVGKKPPVTPISSVLSGSSIYPNTLDVTGDISITGDIVISGDSLRDKIEDLQEQLNGAMDMIEHLRSQIEG